MTKLIICECGHSKDNHGIQSGCAQCQCVKSQSSVMVEALTARVKELEAALEHEVYVIKNTISVLDQSDPERPWLDGILKRLESALLRGAK